MKHLLLVLLLCAAGSVLAESEPVITKEMALQAATLFRKADPFSEDARGYAAILIQFTEKSPAVVVEISRKAVPFLENKKIRQQELAILLAAFVAGNIDSQLLRGKKKDDPYAGDLQVIETYREMRKKKSRLKIPEIEKLMELEAAGKLKAHLAAK